MVYSYPTLNTYTHNVAMNIYIITIMYISIKIYRQTILLLWHNVQAYVPIRIAKNDIILYENYYKFSGGRTPRPFFNHNSLRYYNTMYLIKAHF